MRYPLLLVALTSATFIIQLAFPAVTDYFLLSSAGVLAKPYTLVTSIFLHADLPHLGYNMIALAFFGLVLESIVGGRKFLLAFFASGIIAGIASAFFYPASLGASGAVFGVIGALAALRPRMTVFALGAPMPLIAAAVVWLLLDLAGVFYPADIANMAHIAGLAAGVALGAAWLKSFREPRKRKKERVLSEKQLDEWEESWMGY